MSWLKVLGDQIRAERRKQGFSQEELAQKTSITRAQISHIENGRSAPAVNIVTEIAAALGVDFVVDGFRISRDAASSPGTGPVGMPKQLAFSFGTEYRYGASTVEISGSAEQVITVSIRLQHEVA
jgi:transcriptional regulator with XRE-family HTH domain